MKKRIQGFVIGLIVSTLLFGTVFASNLVNIPVVLNDIIINANGKNITTQGKNYTLYNGDKVPFSILYKGTTYVPIRKLSEILDKNVDWNPTNKTATITDKDKLVKKSIYLSWDTKFNANNSNGIPTTELNLKFSGDIDKKVLLGTFDGGFHITNNTEYNSIISGYTFNAGVRRDFYVKKEGDKLLIMSAKTLEEKNSEKNFEVFKVVYIPSNLSIITK